MKRKRHTPRRDHQEAAQIDPLRSEGGEFAKLLIEKGVKVRHETYEAVTHKFFGMGAVVDKARDAVEYAASDLRAAFGGPQPIATPTGVQ